MLAVATAVYACFRSGSPSHASSGGREDHGRRSTPSVRRIGASRPESIVNYWIGCGLAILGVAFLFLWMSRGAKRRIREDGITNANEVGVALSPWVLFPLALIFIVVGIVDVVM
jgi:hypothetical protein